MKKLLSFMFFIFVTFTCWSNDYEWQLLQVNDAFGDPTDEYSLGVLLTPPSDTRHLIPFIGMMLNSSNIPVIIFGSESPFVKYSQYVDLKFKCTNDKGQSYILSRQTSEIVPSGAMSLIYITGFDELITALCNSEKIVMRIEIDDGYYARYTLPVDNFNTLYNLLLN